MNELHKNERSESENTSSTESSQGSLPKLPRRCKEYSKTSYDKKEILIKCYEEGKSVVESSEIAGINRNTAMSIIKSYKKDGCIILKMNRGGKRKSKLSSDILNEVEKLVEANPCITLKKIATQISENKNITLSTTSIFNALKSLRITLKNATINFDRMNSLCTIDKRKQFAIQFSQNAPQSREKIVFIDESGFNCHLRRNKARSKVNTPAHVLVPSVRGRNVSLIAAMNLNGILHEQIIGNSSVNATIFIRFLDELFVKLDEANITRAWLVLDNCAIHKTKEVRDKVSHTSHTLIYLSPYSPMLNPIEKVFSKTKFSARDLLADPQTNLNLTSIIKESLATVTSYDCSNYYLDMSMKLPLAAAGQPLH